MIEYSPVSEAVIRRVMNLVHDHHPLLDECASIGLVFKTTTDDDGNNTELKPDRDGKKIIGTSVKVTDRMKAAGLEYDFLIELNENNFAELTHEQQTAALDHELYHCEVYKDEEGETKFRIRKHDIEEFFEMIDRYGVWSLTLQRIKKAIEQPRLFNYLQKKPGLTTNIEKVEVEHVKAD